MCSQPQIAVARRLRWWPIVGLTLVLGLGAGEAWADIQVHVMNCTDGYIEAQSFDAKDSVKEVAATTRKLEAGESASLHCAGEGKGYCQMVIAVLQIPAEACDGVSGGATGSVQFHLDSGKWAVVTGYEKHKQSGAIYNCKPVVEENQDSSSCN
jgi:hypothetical protein